MKPELDRWNNGDGISLDDWVGCMGNLDLAVGYTTVFWPNFEIVVDYILCEGCSPESIAGFENSLNATPKNVEWVLNHWHILDIHVHDNTEATADRLIHLGNTLKEIHAVKLQWQFLDKPCRVEFYIPED